MKNNKGVTLVELVIVVGIMAVVMGVMGLSINLIFSNKSKSGATNIYNMLGTAQTLGMSKNNCYLALTADEDNVVTVSVVYGGKGGSDFTVVEEKRLDAKVTVKVKIGSAETAISKTYGVMIPVDRRTGAFGKAYNATAGWTNDTAKLLGGYVTDIIIPHGSDPYDIVLSHVSGKFYYK